MSNSSITKHPFLMDNSFILLAEVSSDSSSVSTTSNSSSSSDTFSDAFSDSTNAFPSLTSSNGATIQNQESTLATISTAEYSSSLEWGNYLQAVGIIFFLLLALWYGSKLLKKNLRKRFNTSELPSGSLSLEASLPLGVNKGIYVVRFLNKYLILGVSENNINLLLETDTDNKKDGQEFQHIMQSETDKLSGLSPESSYQSSGEDSSAYKNNSKNKHSSTSS